MPDDLARFFAAYPSVRISLEERLSHDIVGAVVAGRADVGVVALETEHPALEFLPYRKDQLILLAPLAHPIAAKSDVSFAKCLGQPFISLQSGVHRSAQPYETGVGNLGVSSRNFDIGSRVSQDVVEQVGGTLRDVSERKLSVGLAAGDVRFSAAMRLKSSCSSGVASVTASYPTNSLQNAPRLVKSVFVR
ncbi:LysR substrate-binding domain-containing protein [Paraburkholderia sp. GAS348]|uniref:LysR substrate-binding domain-containing protein n=1 Tax=Paraburkholderia sp. GAS348 TaxID=3035132 RepID=UPI003D22FAA3